jgi:hypothetical protein
MRATLAIVLIAAGLALLQEADLGLPASVTLGGPVLIALVAWIIHSARHRGPVPLAEKA